MIPEYILCPYCQKLTTANTFIYTASKCFDCNVKDSNGQHPNLGHKAGDNSAQQQLKIKEEFENLPLPAPIL